jgi:HEAT repeat protein
MRHFAEFIREGAGGAFETGNQAWLRELTEAILSLRAALPMPGEVGEPEPGQVERFYAEAHAIVRAGRLNGDMQDFIDALMVLLDYCPIDERGYAQAAGVEERMFLKLGPRARLVAVRALVRLGELDGLRQAVAALAASAEGPGRLMMLTGIMGGLRNPAFTPFLVRALERSSNERDEGMAVDALGRIGDARGMDVMVKRLAEAMRQLRDPAFERRARMLLMALGRMTRARGFDPAVRNKLVRQIVNMTDAGQRQLAFEAANQMFTLRLEELDAELKSWAAGKAVEAMWGLPPKNLEAVPPGVNGWREPMVNLLKRLGREALPDVLEAAVRYSANYSGAMGAMANVLEAIGDARAADLLSAMARTVLLYREDGRVSYLVKEKTRNAATGQMQDLDRDDLAHTLLHALIEIGGADGTEIVMDLADQVQAGRIVSPGAQTTNLLVETKIRYGRLNEVTRQARAAAIDEKEYAQALADAGGGLLVKKARQIAAMAVLGQARRSEGVRVLIQAFDDKDSMVAGAAHTALGHFMHPLPSETEFSQFLEQLFARPKLLKGRVLERLEAFLEREIPKKPPYDRVFERQVAVDIADALVEGRLRKAAHAPLPPPPQDENREGEERPEAAEERPANDQDMRRQWLQARQQWVRGGKQGPPPKLPGE